MTKSRRHELDPLDAVPPDAMQLALATGPLEECHNNVTQIQAQ